MRYLTHFSLIGVAELPSYANAVPPLRHRRVTEHTYTTRIETEKKGWILLTEENLELIRKTIPDDLYNK